VVESLSCHYLTTVFSFGLYINTVWQNEQKLICLLKANFFDMGILCRNKQKKIRFMKKVVFAWLEKYNIYPAFGFVHCIVFSSNGILNISQGNCE
jgi:hypothetical protein